MTLFTTQEACEYLQKHCDTVRKLGILKTDFAMRRLCRTGIFPNAFMQSNKWLIPQSDLVKYIAKK